jgi:hypothetical protein
LLLIKNKQLINLRREDYNYFINNLFEKTCEDFYSDDLKTSIRRDKASYGLAYICSLAKKDGRKIYISGQGADEIISDYGMDGRKIYDHSSFGGKFPDNLNSMFPWKSFFGGTQ